MEMNNIQYRIDKCFDRTRIDHEALKVLLTILATRDESLLKKIEDLKEELSNGIKV